MQINRKEFAEELKLRKYIRKAIQIVENKRKNAKNEVKKQEEALRGFIRQLISEAGVSDAEDAPHKSTGINILEDLLKKIIPIIEIDFKKLTTSEEQRGSYRAHFLQGIKNLLAPAAAVDQADQDGEAVQDEFISVNEQDDEIEINIGGDSDPEEFIDVRGDNKEDEKSKEDIEKDTFSISGQDETGRDMSYSTFKKVQGSMLDSWEVLSNADDKELFYDYLLTNLKLYFDKFEDELKANLPEPTTPEYEKAKGEDEL
tara:strand:+ start:241 stop:1014 length:774 start_codon:yes stop_codon:yes gene_type:complete